MIQSIQHPDVVRCFVDTEFYEDGATIDMISLGAVRSDGGEFYAVNQDAKLDLVSDWVRAHVLPKLPPYGDPAWKTREQIAKDFSVFVGACEGEPIGRPVSEIWGYYSDYDWVVIAQMYGTMMKLPKHFPKFCFDLKQLSMMLGSPTHPPDPEGEHNALVDARWNHELYVFLRRYAQANLGHLLRIDEGERQMMLLALAHLANERPGWDDALNRIAEYGSRKQTCKYAWMREARSRGKWGEEIRTSFTCDADKVFNVDGYKPGDFRQFFNDPRTRGEYLRWAPLLLEAEEYHAGNREVSPAPEPKKRKPSSWEAQRAYRRRKERLALDGKAVRFIRDVTTKGGTTYKKGSLWRARARDGGIAVFGINEDGTREKSDRSMHGLQPGDLVTDLSTPDDPSE